MALTARGTAALSARAVAFTHLVTFGVWLGSNVWTTFIAGITMFKNTPRQSFGRLQARPHPATSLKMLISYWVTQAVV